jgi:hypothetical protein
MAYGDWFSYCQIQGHGRDQELPHEIFAGLQKMTPVICITQIPLLTPFAGPTD